MRKFSLHSYKSKSNPYLCTPFITLQNYDMNLITTRNLHAYAALFLFVISFTSFVHAQTSSVGQSLLKEAKEKIEQADPQHRFLRFSFITDTHRGGKTALVRHQEGNIRLFSQLSNDGTVDFAAHGGDWFNAYDCKLEDALRYINEEKSLFNIHAVPFYTTKGNHDCNGKALLPAKPEEIDWIHDRYCVYDTLNGWQGYQPITKEKWDGVKTLHTYIPDLAQQITRYQHYAIHMKGLDIVTNGEDLCSNYFYKDFDKYKIRFVSLCYYDSDTLELKGIHPKQAEWLRTEALDLSLKPQASDWRILFMIHSMPTSKTDTLNRILTNFNEKHPGVLIGCVHGHTHVDELNEESGFPIIGVSAGFCIDKDLGTKDEFCFSVFTIDTDKRLIRETRIGRGEDRLFKY